MWLKFNHLSTYFGIATHFDLFDRRTNISHCQFHCCVLFVLFFTVSSQHPVSIHVSGTVKSRVATLNRQLTGSIAGDGSRNRNSSMPHLESRVRHDTAEQGARLRRRSRGGNDSSVRPGGVTGRTQPVRPEEEQEWLQALEATNDRINTHDRMADVCTDITDFR